MEVFAVKLISSQLVKPSSPTPSTHKTFTLSYLDQSFPPAQVPSLLIYPNAIQPNADDHIITALKTSLSHTLTSFYPLAGRCQDQYTVSCNDQGVLFNETHVNWRLQDFLNSPRKLDLTNNLLPPPVDIFSLFSQPISDFIPLSIQVNIFKCGGLGIGSYFFHKLLDASSFSCFLNHWAAIASHRSTAVLLQPDYMATVTAFPPHPPPPPPPNLEKPAVTSSSNGENMALLWHRLKSIKVVGKTLVFSRIAIDQLKATLSKSIPTTTSFEVVAGFIWQNIMAASEIENQPPVPTLLSFSVNIRPRTTPPLPKESMGNLVVYVHACSQICGQLSDHVNEIHAAILTVGKKVENMQGENGAEAFLEERQVGIVQDPNATKYTLTSWCRLGFNEVNFGFGKPSMVIPVAMVHPFLRNTMVFVDYSDSHGDGIQVWLFLEEKVMQNLESNQRFRAFASFSS